MKLLTIILLFVSSHVLAQGTKKMGKIRAGDTFDCSAYTFIHPLYGEHPGIDSAYGIKHICESENEIEIRFSACHGPMPIFEIIILSLKNAQWSAKKFEFYIQKGYLYPDSAMNAESEQVFVSPVKSPEGLDKIFDKLKKNNIFSLPDFSEIKNKPHGPSCGTMYLVTFKKGDQFRTYSFHNADYYVVHDSRKVFMNYYNIAEILSKELVKE